MMSENEVVEWQPKRLLFWTEFKAEPHPATYQDAISKIKYHHTWTVTSEKMGKEIFFSIENITLKTEFLKNLSWVREKMASDNLLRHQQGFFDLAEELRPKITKKLEEMFYNKKFIVRGKNEAERLQFAREDSGSMIYDALNQLFEDIYLKEAEKYDSETEFGENQEKQQYYNERFSKLHH